MPFAVAELGRGTRGTDNVGEEQGREHAIARNARPRAGEELLDLVQHDLGIRTEHQPVGALQCDIARVRDVLRDVLAVTALEEPVLRGLEHKRRHRDVRELVAHIECQQRLVLRVPRRGGLAPCWPARDHHSRNPGILGETRHDEGRAVGAFVGLEGLRHRGTRPFELLGGASERVVVGAKEPSRSDC